MSTPSPSMNRWRLPGLLVAMVSLAVLSGGCKDDADEATGGEREHSAVRQGEGGDDDEEAPVLVGERGDGDYEEEFRPVIIPPPSDAPETTTCRRPGGPPKACPISVSTDAEPQGPERECVVYVPGGHFLMGAQATDPDEPGYDPHAEPNEAPPHRVELSPFWIQRYEVSNKDFAECVSKQGCSAGTVRSEGLYCYSGKEERRFPVTGVSWVGANEYCAWIGGALPTEAQWEFAARGQDGRLYPWGNDEPNCARATMTSPGPNRAWDYELRYCTFDGPQPAARLTFGNWSAFGAGDMAGNVWEWVADRYAPYPEGQLPVTDPTGPTEGERRVQRGGGYDDGPEDLRSSKRAHLDPEAKLCDVGFRCAFSAQD